MRKRLGIFNMFWHVTWKLALLVLIVGTVPMIRMKEVCEEYCDSVQRGLKEAPIYFQDVLSESHWATNFLLTFVILMIVLCFVPLWQGSRNGFYTQLRLPMKMQEYVVLQWIHSFVWFFFHWVSQLLVLYLLFEIYENCVIEELRGSTSFVFGIIRSTEAMRWYPLVVLPHLIPWVIQVALFAFTPVYASACILTGHKWGTVLIVIHVVGMYITWSFGVSLGGVILWEFFSIWITVWMVNLTRDYLTIEKGL